MDIKLTNLITGTYIRLQKDTNYRLPQSKDFNGQASTAVHLMEALEILSQIKYDNLKKLANDQLLLFVLKKEKLDDPYKSILENHGIKNYINKTTKAFCAD